MSSSIAFPKPSFRLIQVPHDSPQFSRCQEIRMTVFVDEQGYSKDEEMDEYDNQCIHLLLMTNDEKEEPVGTLRYFPPRENSTKSNKLGRVAVMKKHRGKGAAGFMLRGLESMLLDGQIDGVDGKDVKEINCNAQVPVVPLYKGLGYVTEGEVFLEDGTPHIFMRKKLLPSGKSVGTGKTVEIDV